MRVFNKIIIVIATTIFIVFAFILNALTATIDRIMDKIHNQSSENIRQEIKIKNNILFWGKNMIDLSDIRMIQYGLSKQRQYIFWYVLKNEELHQEANSSIWISYRSRSYKADYEDATILRIFFEEHSIDVFPSMWLMPPIGLMGCTLIGRFKKGDFITLAGDTKRIFITNGLDINSLNKAYALFELETLEIDESIFSIKKDQKEKMKYESIYQAYIMNDDVTLGRGYMFLPWKDNNFLFGQIKYFDKVKSANKYIAKYFGQENNRQLRSAKDCLKRNNP